MSNTDFTVTLLVDQKPEAVFAAINNVRGWWIDKIDGAAEKLNDEFAVQFWDVHYSKQKLVEFIPDKKVVWKVLDSNLNFLNDKQEWNGTTIHFDVEEKDGKTALHFTHRGLVPKIECYKDCSGAWTEYIDGSLKNLITTGKGQPTHMD